MPAVDLLIETFSEGGLAGVLDLLAEKFEWFATMQEIVIGVIDTVKAAWEIFGEDIAGFVVGMVAIIKERVGDLISVLDGVIDFIRAVFTGEWGAAWDAIKQIFDGVWGLLAGAIDQAWLTIKTAVSVLFDGFKLLWDWSFLGEALDSALSAIGGAITGAFGAIVGGFWSLGESIVASIVDGIKAAPGALVDAIEALIPGGGIVGGIIGGIGGLFGGDDPGTAGKLTSAAQASATAPVINITAVTNADAYGIGQEVSWAMTQGAYTQ